ncbi:MAG: MaoC/PaaZ C-terminal domain-containing protein [Sneathiella sp.]
MNVEKVLNYVVPEAIVPFTERDTALYALGVNLGLDPTNESDLQYLYEDGMKALPSFSMVLAHPGFWMRDPEVEIDWVKILHAEQFLTMSKPLPAKGSVKAQYDVLGITDKGPEKGAIVYYEKTLSDVETGDEISRVVTGVFCRGDGGCGNHGDTPEPLQAAPQSKPDLVVTKTIDARSALIYRLSGDYNPLHISPQVAASAGYDRPILHGLCTMGIAGHVLLESLADGDPTRFGGYACRFSRPVFPGDTVRTEVWNVEGGVRFRVIAEDRNEVVLDRGQATIHAP